MTLKDLLRARTSKLSVLDVLTGVVLLIAFYLFVRPGSPAYVSVRQKLAERQQEKAIVANWQELARVAMPLYIGGGEPDIIEFSDYECPFCKEVSPTIDSAIASDVRVAVVHFPLAKHARAVPAAHAALCAARSGKFVEAHHELFSRSDWRSDSASIKLRSNSGSKCPSDQSLDWLLALHLAFAKRLSVKATPAFFSRQTLFKGAPTLANLKLLAQPASN